MVFTSWWDLDHARPYWRFSHVLSKTKLRSRPRFGSKTCQCYCRSSWQMWFRHHSWRLELYNSRHDQLSLQWKVDRGRDYFTNFDRSDQEDYMVNRRSSIQIYQQWTHQFSVNSNLWAQFHSCVKLMVWSSLLSVVQSIYSRTYPQIRSGFLWFCFEFLID